MIRLKKLKIRKNDRVLIIAPHPDDEILSCGGLLIYLRERKIPFKIIYICTGDGVPSFLWQERKFRFSSENYLRVGKKRRREALEGLRVLGITPSRAIFLGYSDGCLGPMWKNPQKLAASVRTKLTFSSYSFAYTKNQEFKGVNLLDDLVSIFKQERPTIVLAPHLKSSHPDHQAAFSFSRKALEKIRYKGELFEYLTSLGLVKKPSFLGMGSFIKIYPPRKKGEGENILYPPLALGLEKQWFSFFLNPEQIEKKEAALQSHQSQIKIPFLKRRFKSLTAQNEIFQKNNDFS